MTIKLVVCVDKKGGISKNGEIAWEIKEDTNFFVDQINNPNLTNKQNKPNKLIVVGKNTYPKVMNIKDCKFLVISTTFISDKENVSVLNNIYNLKTELYTSYINYDIFVLGGKKIYEYVMNTFYNIEYIVSRIDYDYKCDNIIDNFNMIFEISIDYLPSKTFRLTDTKNNIDVSISFYSKHFVNDKHDAIYEEQGYLNLLENILHNGDKRKTRNGYTYSLFGKTLEFNLDKFPLLTTKKMFLKGIFEELMFFIKGDTNSTKLSDIGVKIWEGNTTRKFLDDMGFNNRQIGDMGPMYGFQWRHFNANYTDCNTNYIGKGFDQLQYCINLLKTDPTSRRIIMTTYNPAQAFEGVLFPCHGITIMFYCNLINDNTFRLDLMMTQRSCDLFLGVPFNIASYALFVYLICDHINNSDSKYKYIPGKLIMNLGDVHIYEEHKTQAIRQILRIPCEFPSLKINNKISTLEDYKFEDIEILNYNSYSGIIAKMIA